MSIDESLQARLIGASPRLEPSKPVDYFNELRAALYRAWNDALLDGSLGDIRDNVTFTGDRPKFRISGGIKDFSRRRESARIVRDDGAWIHFTLTLEWDGDDLGLDSYDFEIVFADDHRPPFFRYDLNEPNHPNAEREIRSHCHPGNDDYLVPAPVMSPVEILDALIRGMRARDPERPRE